MYPNLQRKILAELNVCPIGSIDAILEENGIKINRNRTMRKLISDRRMTDDQFLAAYAKGLNDSEIGRMFGVQPETVRKRRGVYKLPKQDNKRQRFKKI